MKKNVLSIALLLMTSLVLASCTTPVLNRNYLLEGNREVSFTAIRENPEEYKGTLYIFGGVIVRTKLTVAGSLIEAIHVPVDGSGYFRDNGRSEGRFLALMPKDGPMLDPAVFHRGRRVSLAAEFVDTRKAKIDDMDYVYPVFLIKQIYLWPHERYYYFSPYYYDPWFYPYPYYYRHPWWRYPHENEPVPVRPRTPPRPKAPSPTDRQRE